MYKLLKDSMEHIIKSVMRLPDNACIPFDADNTDYQQFKIQVTDGIPLEDPDGNVMTQEEVNNFLQTIP